MNSLSALNLLLQRAEQERDKALAVLRQVESQVQRAQAQTQQLENYRGEYDERWTAHFRTSAGPELLHHRREFGQRLDQAITHQLGEVRSLDNRLQLARDTLLERERRVASVRKLIERRTAELRRMADRHEQRSIDEAAQRARANGGGPSALSA